jgi:hypothetical protein
MAIVVCSVLCQQITGTEYYYNGTKKISLRLAPDFVTLKLGTDSHLVLDTLLRAGLGLNPETRPVGMPDHFYRVGVLSTVDPMHVVETLRRDSRVSYVNPGYVRADSSKVCLTNRLIVKFDSSLSAYTLDSAITAHCLEIDRKLFRSAYFLVMSASSETDSNTIWLANQYVESGLAVYAIPDMSIGIEPCSDPYFQYQWQYCNTGQYGGTPGADIELLPARQYILSGVPIRTAILDFGLDSHEDIRSGLFVDGYDFYNDDSDPSSVGDDWHGMMCLGAFAATTGNDIGIEGIIDQETYVIPLKILQAGCDETEVPIVSAISHAVDHGATIMSCSWGWPYELIGEQADSAIIDAVQLAHSFGVMMFFASGNDGAQTQVPVSLPGRLDEAFAVGGSDINDARVSTSSYGPEPDVVAPSSWTDEPYECWSLDRMGIPGHSSSSQMCEVTDLNYNCRAGGTSLACPTAAGVATLVLRRRPDLVGYPDYVEDVIRYSAERTPYGSAEGDTARVNDYVGWGRINAHRALMAVARGDVNNTATIDITDVVYLVNYIFNSGAAPVPDTGLGDCDCSGLVDVSDVVYLIGYIFSSGDAPQTCYKFVY